MTDCLICDSWLNHTPEVREQLNITHQLIINDCTLREGEQAAEVGLNLEQKILLARKLEDIGIPQIQGGYPGRSETDKKFIMRLKNEGYVPKIEAIVQAYSKDWEKQIDAAIESGADIINLMYPSSDWRLKYVQKVTRDEMLNNSVKAVKYAVNRGSAIVRFAPTDATRTDLNFLKEIYAAVIEAGASRISISDTTGAITPQAMRYLVQEVVKSVSVPLQVHCHNDYGLGLANALAAVEAGAQIIDATVNGLGERSGNVSLDELVVTLAVLYEVNLGIKIEGLYDLAHLMKDISGVDIPSSKPLVGENAFAHKLDAHVQGVLTHPQAYETIQPEKVGNKRKIPLGKYSGPFIIKQKLNSLNLDATSEQIALIQKGVEKKAVSKKSSLTEDEFLTIYNQIVNN